MSLSSAALYERYGPVYRWLVTVAGLAAFFTMVFSSTMVNVAIPHVMGAFGVGQDKAQFLSSAFLSTTVTSLLLNSWLIARIGQPAAFSASLLVFLVGSFICAAAPNLDTLILGRVIQGFAAGIIQPLVMVLLFQIFPPEKRGTAMGLFSMGVVFALGLGPCIGGVTIDLLDWRYIFWVPIPLAVLSLILGALFVPDRPQSERAGSFDILGYALMCAAVFCLMTIIGNGQRLGWGSDEVAVLGICLCLAVTGFLFSQRRRGANLLDLTLFRNRRFATAISISFLFGFGSFATVYIFPVFAQIVQGYTPTEAGSLLLPGSLFAAMILPVTGKLADRFPPRTLILAGMGIFAFSVVLMADADVDTVFWSIALYLLVGRIGVALVSPSVNSAAIAALPASQVNRGAGLVNLSLMLGGSCGISTLVVILERRIQFHGQAFASTQTSDNNATREMLGTVERVLHQEGIPNALHEPIALNYLGEVVHAQANTLGFQDGFLAVALASLLAVVPTLLLSRSRRANG